MFGFMKKQTNKDLMNSIKNPHFITQQELDFLILQKRMEMLNYNNDDLVDNEHIPDNPELELDEKH